MFMTIPGIAQGLLLFLLSGFSSGCVWGTTWDTADQTQVVLMQAKVFGFLDWRYSLVIGIWKTLGSVLGTTEKDKTKAHFLDSNN